MSLASLAIRLATIRALKGRTFAQENVFDSKMDPLDLVAQGGGFEFVAVVTTDDDNMTVDGRDLRAPDHRLELVIEVAATAKLAVEAEDGAEVLTIPATDAGLEVSLDLIGWQIIRALTADGGEWGDLWRSLVMDIREVSSRRGADESKGVRFAARQYTMTLDHVAEPEPGVEPTDLWARVVTMLKADAEFAAIGKIIETTITAGEPEPWERVRASLGLAVDASGHFAEWPFVPEDVSNLHEIETTQDSRVLDAGLAESTDGPEDGS